MEDPLLAGRAAPNDGPTIERLLERHLPAVRAFVRVHMGQKLRAKESTSDLVQSVCRELLTHQARFQHAGEPGFQAWLFTTARRKIANRARDLERQKRQTGREVDDLSESAVADLGAAYARISSPSGRLLRAEEVARLEAAIDRLPAEQREAITLAHLVGLSRAEIGQQLDKTEEAVRALLHRAKARLAMLLSEPA
jgi:RNA polymerase sigma-70 factor (ECF subfamily)